MSCEHACSTLVMEGSLNRSRRGSINATLKGVHGNLLVIGAQLQQAQARVVGLLAHELGVDRQDLRGAGSLGELLELSIGCNEHGVTPGYDDKWLE